MDKRNICKEKIGIAQKKSMHGFMQLKRKHQEN
jgi:hypothetical protein